MKKSTYWIIWSLVVIIINIGVIPIAGFSLFTVTEGTSIFSVDYLVAFLIILFANIASIQLFISSRKQDQKSFLLGLILVVIEVCAFILIINVAAPFSVCITMVAISVVGAIVLLVKSFIR